MSEIAGLDFSATKPDPATLKRQGFTFVLGYLKPPPNSKELDAGHLAAYRAAGLEVGVVWETTADRALSGAAGGAADGAAALARAAAVGYPRGCVIFTAVDFDPTAGQMPAILAYAEAFADVVAAGGYPPGVYGGLATVEAAYARRPTLYLWQTAAWSGGKLSPHAHLYQRSKPSGRWPAVPGTDENVKCAPLPLYGATPQPTHDTPPEDDMPTLQEIHDAVWFGAPGATLLPNEAAGKPAGQGEWASTALGSMVARMSRDVVTPQIVGLTAAVDKLATAVASGRNDLTADELRQAISQAITDAGAALRATQTAP